MLQRLPAVLIRAGRERLSAQVEVGEAYICGEEPGLPGGRACGKKFRTGLAVDVWNPPSMGWCRIAPLAGDSEALLRQFVTDHVGPGATIITNGWRGNSGLTEFGYTLSNERRSQRAGRSRGIRTIFFPACIKSFRWPRGGCSACTTARSSRPIWRAISASSCYNSTVGNRGL